MLIEKLGVALRGLFIINPQVGAREEGVNSEPNP